MRDEKKILVIGAGVAGAAAALRLSSAGIGVYLIEKQASIGGYAAQMGCKATDECLRCNVCVANQLLRDAASSDSIAISTRTELLRLGAGKNGTRFEAELEHYPTFIDRAKCIGCQICVRLCPEKCITIPAVALSPSVPVIDYSKCRNNRGKKCSRCKTGCPTGAIDIEQKKYQSTIEVDNVVVAVGFRPYEPTADASWGYGSCPDIITGLEAEHQLAQDSRLVRPSDGRPPKRIAFIQCVGSRSEFVHRRPEDTDYCSVVCCAYALRMARLLKHKQTDAQITVFYMDIQNFGKGFNEFFNDCQDEMRFVRCRPYELKGGSDGSVIVTYTPPAVAEDADSQLCRAEFDLVILAVGIRPGDDTIRLSERMLLPVDEYGFLGLKSPAALPELQRESIYAVGACESPKDIAGCIAQAEAVCSEILEKR